MKLILVIAQLLVLSYEVSARSSGNEPLKFLTEAWPYKLKFMSEHDTTVIPCQTNHMFARLYLYKRYNLRDSWRNALAMDRGRHITIVGQAFYIKDLAVKDSGYYKCVATKYWSGEQKSLELGQIIVTPIKKTEIRVPEIFPNDSRLKVKQNRNQNITCKTIGAVGPTSYLKWYKRVGKEDMKPVNPNQVASFSMLSKGDHIDIEKLVFKRFQLSDAGVYVCERKEPFQQPTRRQIKIETDVHFVFKAPRWRIGVGVPLKIALINDFVFISCQTSSMYAHVVLMKKRSQGAPWHIVKTSYHGRIRRIGQTFLIKKLSYTDSAYYKCRAQYQGSTIEMEKGMLIASIADNNDQPTIIPRKHNLHIPKGSNQDIVCKAPSVQSGEESFIRWYKKVGRDIYVQVKGHKVDMKKMFTRGKTWDIHMLKIRGFDRVKDVGRYACVRYVVDRPATVAYVHVKMAL